MSSDELPTLEELEQLGIVRFCEQPESALRELAFLEETYGVTTADVLAGRVTLDPDVEAMWRYQHAMMNATGGGRK